MKLILNLITVIALSLPLMLTAAEKGPAKSAEKPAAKTPEAAKPKRLPLKGTVVAITTRTLTLKGGEGKEDRKFTINKDTEILKGEAAATTDDVKPGQIITGSYVKNEDGSATLTKLQTAPKPSTPAKKPAATEEGKTKKGESETGKKKASE